MPVIGVAGECPGTDDQPLFLRDREAHLNAELVGLACLSFPDAFNFRSMQCVEFVLVLWTLAANAPGPLKPDAQLCLPFVRSCGQLAFDIAQQPSQDCALTFEYTTQALELLRMCIPACAATQPLAFALVRLLQPQPCALRQLNESGPRHLKQTAVGRIRNRLLLNRGVDNHALEFDRRHRLHLHRSCDRRRKQLLDTGFAQRLSKAHQVGRVTRQTRWKYSSP